MSRNSILMMAALSMAAVIDLPTAEAVPAFSDPQHIFQTDGTAFEGRVMGDEWCNWTETVDGYVVAENAQGDWHFVTGYAQGRARLGARVMADGLRRGLAPGLVPECATQRHHPSHDYVPNRQEAVTSGREIPVLFILTQFTDRKGVTTPEDFQSAVGEELLDYFETVSYGADTLVLATENSGTANDGIVGWVDLDYRHPNTGSSSGRANKKLSRDAIEAADEFVDFASYDVNGDGFVDADELGITVVVAGYERAAGPARPSIWAHMWNLDGVGAAEVDGVKVGLSNNGRGGYAQFGELHGRFNGNPATMGIMAHELGHLIYRLPDLYDYDGTSNGSGAWCLMSYGAWGWSDDDIYAGATPVGAGAWVRYAMGWSHPSQAAGEMEFTAVGSANADGENTLTLAETRESNEFFLIENRQPLGYDRGLERLVGSDFGGLAIWHIDSNQWGNDNDAARLADVEEADGSTSGYESTNLWNRNSGSFDANSSPASDLNDGRKTDVSVSRISVNGDVMTATVED